MFTAFNPIQKPKDFPNQISLNDHHPSFSKFNPQVKAFKTRPQTNEEDTPPYEFKYDVSDISYGTSFNVQVTLVKLKLCF